MKNENKVYLFNGSIFDSVPVKLFAESFSTNIGVSKVNVMNLNGFELIKRDSLLMRNVR